METWFFFFICAITLAIELFFIYYAFKIIFNTSEKFLKRTLVACIVVPIVCNWLIKLINKSHGGEVLTIAIVFIVTLIILYLIIDFYIIASLRMAILHRRRPILISCFLCAVISNSYFAYPQVTFFQDSIEKSRVQQQELNLKKVEQQKLSVEWARKALPFIAELRRDFRQSHSLSLNELASYDRSELNKGKIPYHLTFLLNTFILERCSLNTKCLELGYTVSSGVYKQALNNQSEKIDAFVSSKTKTDNKYIVKTDQVIVEDPMMELRKTSTSYYSNASPYQQIPSYVRFDLEKDSPIDCAHYYSYSSFTYKQCFSDNKINDEAIPK